MCVVFAISMQKGASKDLQIKSCNKVFKLLSGKLQPVVCAALQSVRE